jgi:hypothetical protein
MTRTALAVLATAALLAAPADARADEPFKMISADEAAKLVGAKDVRFLDANPREVFEEARVPGAVLVKKPLAELLPTDRSTRLVFYCRNPK